MKYRVLLSLFALAQVACLTNTHAQSTAPSYSFTGRAGSVADGFRAGRLVGATINDQQLVIADNDVSRLILPNTALDKSLDFTVIASVKLDIQHGGASGNLDNPFNTVLSAASAAPASGGHHRIQQINDNNFSLACYPRYNNWRVYINNNYYNFPTGAAATRAGVWYQVAFVRQGAQGTFFLNGRKVGGSVVVNADTIHVDPGGLIVGQDQDTLRGHFQRSQSLAGRVRQLAVYRSALSSEDIAAAARQASQLGNAIWADAAAAPIRRACLSTYPNPVTDGTLHVELSEIANSGAANRVTLENRFGVTVRQTILPVELGRGAANLNTAGLPAGPYLIRVSVGSTGETIKQLVVVE